MIIKDTCTYLHNVRFYIGCELCKYDLYEVGTTLCVTVCVGVAVDLVACPLTCRKLCMHVHVWWGHVVHVEIMQYLIRTSAEGQSPDNLGQFYSLGTLLLQWETEVLLH